MKTSAVRLTATAIAFVLTLVCGYYAALDGIASLGPDGTWIDTLEFLACTTATLLFGTLAVGGTR